MAFWSLKSKDNQNRLYNITNVTQFKLKIKIPSKKIKNENRRCKSNKR